MHHPVQKFKFTSVQRNRRFAHTISMVFTNNKGFYPWWPPRQPGAPACIMHAQGAPKPLRRRVEFRRGGVRTEGAVPARVQAARDIHALQYRTPADHRTNPWGARYRRLHAPPAHRPAQQGRRRTHVRKLRHAAPPYGFSLATRIVSTWLAVFSFL